MYYLGIDLGTTGCKSILFKNNGEITGESYVEYPLIYTGEGHIEQDADLWWDLVKQVVRDTVTRSGVAPGEIESLSVSSQGITFVPVDRDGRTMYNALSWLDIRATAEVGYISSKFTEQQIFARTGKRINPAYSLPKWMWLKQNKPEIYAGAWKLLMGLDFITFRLTGRTVTDHSMAAGTMAYNITDRCWDAGILDVCGIDVQKLPEIHVLGTRISNVSADVAAEMGLTDKTAVYMGAQDQKCAAIGAGITQGICTASLGTATAIETVGDRPMLDPQMRIPCFSFDEDRWVLEAVLATSGASLKWLKQSLFPDRSYARLDEMAALAQAGSAGVYFYPHLEGATSPFWSAGCKGFMYGIGLNTSANDIVRALYEGIAFQMKANLDVLEQLGPPLSEIRIFGGGAKSDIWCRIIADVTGKTVTTLFTAEMANYGAALIAGMRSELKTGQTFRPDAAEHEKYENIYKKYIETQEKIL